ncbi:MAG: hypothetical protein HY268_27135 [Deltaproteobacteria bacterium]|nr:hypothetical protein [Deltaproteobacteria bacterium]
MPHYWSAEGGLARLVRTGLVAVLIPLAGCATAYQPEKVTGGYTDFRLADNTYRIRFKGNNYTSRDKVELFLLYRCAELTEQLGYDHFVLLSEDTLDISDPFAQAGVFPRNYYATALIQVVDDRAHPAAYDAKELMRELQAQYPNELGS